MFGNRSSDTDMADVAGLPLAGRVEVPAVRAWDRHCRTASQTRIDTLQNSFDEQFVQDGLVLALAGPHGAGKTEAAIALCDLRGLRPVFATEQRGAASFRAQPGICVIVDAVSSFQADNVHTCVAHYRGTCPLILVDRHQQAILKPGIAFDRGVELKLPDAAVIATYLTRQLSGYRTAIDPASTQQISADMQNHFLSLAQINEVVNDAALACLQDDREVGLADIQRSLHELLAVRSNQRPGVTA